MMNSWSMVAPIVVVSIGCWEKFSKHKNYDGMGFKTSQLLTWQCYLSNVRDIYEDHQLILVVLVVC